MKTRDGGAPLTPGQGTALFGFVNWVASLAAFITQRYFEKKELLIWGHIGMAVNLVLLGFLEQFN